MLYELREWQHTLWTPWRIAGASARAMLTELPPSALETPLARSWLAGQELFERATRRWERPQWHLDSTIIDERIVPVRTETVWRRPFCELTHFVRETEREDPRVLIVAPLSGHFATLLRGTVEALLPEHDVYVTEWSNARDVPVEAGTFDLDDYVDYVIDWIHTLGPSVHVLAVCQPVVPVSAAVALLAAANDPVQPRTLTLMAGPLDARRNPTVVNELATSRSVEWFERHMTSTVPGRYAGAGRKVYPGFVQLFAFMSMNPERHFEAHMKLYEDIAHGNDAGAERHRRFYDEYLSVIDMTTEYYLQTVDRVFQRFELAQGEFVSRGRPVDLAAIRRPALMTVEGEQDDITGLGQTSVAHDLMANVPEGRRAHHLQLDVGHFGVFSGHHWRTETMPRFREFVREHDRDFPG